ncbi:MAG: hypothetical protein WCG27_02520 [Pseudomonadota bacterium]
MQSKSAAAPGVVTDIRTWAQANLDTKEIMLGPQLTALVKTDLLAISKTDVANQNIQARRLLLSAIRFCLENGISYQVLRRAGTNEEMILRIIPGELHVLNRIGSGLERTINFSLIFDPYTLAQRGIGGTIIYSPNGPHQILIGISSLIDSKNDLAFFHEIHHAWAYNRLLKRLDYPYYGLVDYEYWAMPP